MFSKSLAVGALIAGCVSAAAGGAYVALRHDPSTPQPVVSAPASATTAIPAPAAAVAETEAVVTSPAPPAAKAEAEPRTQPQPQPRPRIAPPAPARTVNAPTRPQKPATAQATRPAASSAEPRRETAQATANGAPEAPRDQPAAAVPPREVREPAAEAAPAAAPVEPPARQFEQLVIPASSVVGLRVETSLSTERARLEDRVEARVTRDLLVDERVVVPAGTRAIGTVTLVERGGKMKDRARLGVRFHTLALADGTELPINTEAIYREGDSPTGESARKIGGAAAGGAILGALLGGKKGAIVGATTGAAGGTAVVMAGDRNAATLPSGTIVTIKLAAPVGVEVEKR
jgi:type IV secretory pathway VirB10-like protein